LDARHEIFGMPTGIVGIGAFATSITLTIFYAIMLLIWKERFGKEYGWFEVVLFSAALIRLIILAFPGNKWGSPTSPYDWAIYRNIPVILFVQKMPLIGMLMIPKTLAYVAIAVIAYKHIFKVESV